MRPGRELDTRVAREIFGHHVWASNKIIYEKTQNGKRPLRNYSKEMEWAWEVADKMKITLLPIEGGQWFAFSDAGEGWKSPQDFIETLQKGEFVEGGAAIGDKVALVICTVAIKAVEKDQSKLAQPMESDEVSDEEEVRALH